ncbi:MAG: heme/hemin ABC transporter substrate-binding protein [Imperialibacter sp.]|uniref:heme/hemin ABC transporter substrate-binding protein n=1 Tax=Imperialibacter sp. TaxID=2038411 RepID=UPI0030DD3023|tara:strand:+ start:1276 stop:2154 length:879 start_codon:yes stop_codon:yes gene_type:complete
MKKLYLVAIVALLLAGCGRFGNEDKKTNNAERIVCIAKQYTEIIFALGAEKDIAAVDVSSTYPPEATELPTVGYHRALSAEGVLAAKPTLIIHDNNIGPEHVVKQLEDLKIPMKVFDTKDEDIESTKALMKEMGQYFHKEAAADSLCKKLDADMKLALDNTANYADSLNVLVIHFGQASNVFLVMTKKSTAAKMINWAGAKMAVDDERGMRQLSAEVVAASNPDVILLTDFGYDRLGTSEKIMELPGIAGTKAAQNNRIYRVEEHDMVYIGPRTGENVLMLQKLIHQDEAQL